MGRRINALRVEIPVKHCLQQLRGNAAAGIRQSQLYPLGLNPHFQGYAPPFWGKLKSVGKEVQQQPLQPVPVYSDNMGTLGTAEVQLQAQQFRRHLNPANHVPAKVYDVVVAEPGPDGLIQNGGVGEVVSQTQDPVVALAEDSGIHIQSVFLVPKLRRSNAFQRVVNIVQGTAQLAGYLLQHLAQLRFFSLSSMAIRHLPAFSLRNYR